MKRSSRQLLVGLKDQNLRFADVWCDLDEVRALSESGLIRLDVAAKTVSLTEKGKLAIEETASAARSVRSGSAHWQSGARTTAAWAPAATSHSIVPEEPATCRRP